MLCPLCWDPSHHRGLAGTGCGGFWFHFSKWLDPRLTTLSSALVAWLEDGNARELPGELMTYGLWKHGVLEQPQQIWNHPSEEVLYNLPSVSAPLSSAHGREL